jgi:hypothetical protein
MLRLNTPNVEVTGAARLHRAASVWTAGLAIFPSDQSQDQKSDIASFNFLVFCLLSQADFFAT